MYLFSLSLELGFYTYRLCENEFLKSEKKEEEIAYFQSVFLSAGKNHCKSMDCEKH